MGSELFTTERPFLLVRSLETTRAPAVITAARPWNQSPRVQPIPDGIWPWPGSQPSRP